MVILDAMDYHVRPEGIYPDSFMSISSLEVCQEGGSFIVVLGGCWGFLIGDLEDRVILDVMDVLGRPQGSYPESFNSSLPWASLPCVKLSELKRVFHNWLTIAMLGLCLMMLEWTRWGYIIPSGLSWMIQINMLILAESYVINNSVTLVIIGHD